MQDDFKERRRFIRFILEARASVTLSNGVSKEGEIESISSGGMYIRHDYQIPDNIIHDPVQATIIANTSGGELTINVECTVVRRDEDGAALFFNAINKTNRLLLRDLLNELNTLVRKSRINNH